MYLELGDISYVYMCIYTQSDHLPPAFEPLAAVSPGPYSLWILPRLLSPYSGGKRTAGPVRGEVGGAGAIRTLLLLY